MLNLSKETLDLALIVQNVIQFHLQVTNDKRGIELFIKQVRKHDKSFSFENSLFCMEHTARAALGNLSLRRTVIIHFSTIYIKNRLTFGLNKQPKSRQVWVFLVRKRCGRPVKIDS